MLDHSHGFDLASASLKKLPRHRQIEMESKRKTKRKAIAIVISILMISMIVVAVWPESDLPIVPPSIKLVSVEPSGMIDDSGIECLMVAYKLQSQTNILIRNEGQAVEVYLQNGSRLAPGISVGKGLLIVPGNSTSCRLSLQCGRIANTSTFTRGITSKIFPCLPKSLRNRAISWFGVRWFYPDYSPKKWHDVWVELEIPAKSHQQSKSND
jgi:hypothetical protein